MTTRERWQKIGRRLAFVFLTASLGLLLSGCLGLRLLAFKNQLADFDRYVQVDEHEGLSFHFLKPVLYTDDFRELLKTEPTLIVTNGNRQTWQWTFEKVRSTNDVAAGEFDLTFTTSFKGEKMDGFGFPEQVLVMLPAPFIVGMFRSLGHAEINEQKRSASARWQGGETRTKPITRDTVTRLLGAPLAITESNLTYSYRYEYRLQTSSPTALKYRLVSSELTFDRDNDCLVGALENLAGMQIQLAFDAPPEPATNAPASK